MGKKSKGSDFERAVSKQLSLWWTNGERDDVFWRSSQSGGRATVRGRKGTKTANSYGDIGLLDECGAPLLRILILELKRGYGTWSIQDLLDSGPTCKKPKLNEFLAQAARDAEAAGGLWPCVIFKKDLRRPGIVTPLSLWKQLTRSNHNDVFDRPHIIYRNDESQLIMMLLDDFLEWCSPEPFLNGEIECPSKPSAKPCKSSRTVPPRKKSKS